MTLETLVSAVKEDVAALAEKMNLQSDAVIINQCNENGYLEYEHNGNIIRGYSFFFPLTFPSLSPLQVGFVALPFLQRSRAFCIPSFCSANEHGCKYLFPVCHMHTYSSQNSSCQRHGGGREQW